MDVFVVGGVCYHDNASKIPQSKPLSVGGFIYPSAAFEVRKNTIKDGVGKTGYIVGVTKKMGTPVSRRVACMHRESMSIIYQTLSDEQGNYRFDGLIAGVEYATLALDNKNAADFKNAAIQDRLVAQNYES